MLSLKSFVDSEVLWKGYSFFKVLAELKPLSMRSRISDFQPPRLWATVCWAHWVGVTIFLDILACADQQALARLTTAFFCQNDVGVTKRGAKPQLPCLAFSARSCSLSLTPGLSGTDKDSSDFTKSAPSVTVNLSVSSIINLVPQTSPL